MIGNGAAWRGVARRGASWRAVARLQLDPEQVTTRGSSRSQSTLPPPTPGPDRLDIDKDLEPPRRPSLECGVELWAWGLGTEWAGVSLPSVYKKGV